MKYLLRALKYFLRLTILTAIVLSIMLLSGLTMLDGDTIIYILTGTTQGYVLLLGMLLLSAVYPKIGFSTTKVVGNLAEDQDIIDQVMLNSGYKPLGEGHYQLINPVKRALALYEDQVQISQSGPHVEFAGPTREINTLDLRYRQALREKK